MNGGQVAQPQHQQQQHQQRTPETQDSAQAKIEMTTVAGATPQAQTVKMQQQAQQDAPAPTITPATATASTPSMTAAATNGGSSHAGANTSAGTSAATGSGTGTGTGTGTSNASAATTVTAATAAAINKKRKKDGLKPIITTESSGYVLCDLFLFLATLRVFCDCVLRLRHIDFLGCLCPINLPRPFFTPRCRICCCISRYTCRQTCMSGEIDMRADRQSVSQACQALTWLGSPMSGATLKEPGWWEASVLPPGLATCCDQDMISSHPISRVQSPRPCLTRAATFTGQRLFLFPLATTSCALLCPACPALPCPGAPCCAARIFIPCQSLAAGKPGTGQPWWRGISHSQSCGEEVDGGGVGQ